MQLSRQITAVLLMIALTGLTGCIVWPYGGEGDRGDHAQRDHRGGQHDEGRGDRNESRR
jgi:hypothetical protein